MKRFLLAIGCLLAVLVLSAPAFAKPAPTASIGSLVSNAENAKDLAPALQMMLGFAALSLAPALLIMMTSFTRIIIVLSFLRSALGTQQTPPNAVLVGFALFLTFYIMAPVGDQINRQALQPYLAGHMSFNAALSRGSVPVQVFLLRQVREKDLSLFIGLARLPRPKTPAQVPMRALVPAFIISELRAAFQIGFVLFIPFVVVDLIVSSVLMSMGMMMLPPVMISLPIKILLFVMVDGWHLITQSLVLSFS
jgi:flagellar biosynthesis protein FliP